MSQERYVMLEIRPAVANRDDFDFGPESVDQPPEVAFSAEHLTEAQAAEAGADPRRVVAKVMPIALLEPVPSEPGIGNGTPCDSWGIEAVRADRTALTGKGIKVAILDTGIVASLPTFNGVSISQRNFTHDPNDEDTDGHGTHCAGTVLGRPVNGCRIGVAPGITDLLVGKVLGQGGDTEGILQAIFWAATSGASIISMSLGIDFPKAVAQQVAQGIPVQSATSRALTAYRDNVAAFDQAAALLRNASFGHPVLIVAASGNGSHRQPPNDYTVAASPPSTSTGVVAVGAIGPGPTPPFSVAPFSNTSPKLVAPGVNIMSAKLGGGLTAMSGTSMATPHVAGVAALWAEQLLNSTNSMNVGALEAKLTQSCVAVPGSWDDIGEGLVQAP
jgi:subtilisin family serine protease